MTKKNTIKGKRIKTSLDIHNSMTEYGVRTCGCSINFNPNFCPYQEFIDGFSFIPDVGNGQIRGEIFTPRFIVDKMITESGMFPKDAVYDFEYTKGVLINEKKVSKWDDERLKHFIGQRVFEPAVGCGNFAATILWNKLEFANILALKNLDLYEPGSPRYKEQIRRYETYTLVALSSLYCNDIDVGNLQITKWRLCRDAGLYSKSNVQFWSNNIKETIDNNLINKFKITKRSITNMVSESLLKASDALSYCKGNGGVLDDLYLKHTGNNPPEWLKASWLTILNHNAKFFSGITEEDVINKSIIDPFDICIVPGYKNISWIFWWFEGNAKTHIKVTKRRIPLRRQILLSEINEIKTLIKNYESNADESKNNGAPNSKNYIKKLELKISELNKLEEYLTKNNLNNDVEYIKIYRKNDHETLTKFSKPSSF